MEQQTFKLCMYGCGNKCKEPGHDVDAWCALIIAPVIFIGILLFNAIPTKDQ